jgi:hypothetical protein
MGGIPKSIVKNTTGRTYIFLWALLLILLRIIRIIIIVEINDKNKIEGKKRKEIS